MSVFEYLSRPRRAGAWLGGFVGGALTIAALSFGWSHLGIQASASVSEPAGIVAAPSVGAAVLHDGFADLVAKVSPAVVTIRSERLVQPTAQQMPFDDDTWLRRFFGDRLPQMPRQRREGGLGSGVVVTSDGYVLTNHHVVAGAKEVRVELSDRRSFEAKVVGSDQPSDLAVLKIESRNLPTLTLGDSDSVRSGDIVLAFGNPLGVGQTVTMGIISAKGRATGLGDGSFEDFLQTDAPIDQGNSGGALVNTKGEVVGINSQILSPSGGNIGIGFAIPANMARGVMDQLVDHGSVRRGLLGVTVQGVTSDMAKSLGLSEIQGAIVSGVTPDGPAARAGIKRGDVVVALNGKPVADSNSLRNAVAGLEPGTRVTLSVLRDGRREEIPATLGQLEAKTRGERGERATGGEVKGRYGMALESLTPDIARRLETDVTKGVVVDDVDPVGAAAEAGLREGDVILEINRTAVSTPQDVKRALDGSTDKPALVLVARGNNTLYLTLRQPAG